MNSAIIFLVSLYSSELSLTGCIVCVNPLAVPSSVLHNLSFHTDRVVSLTQFLFSCLLFMWYERHKMISFWSTNLVVARHTGCSFYPLFLSLSFQYETECLCSIGNFLASRQAQTKTILLFHTEGSSLLFWYESQWVINVPKKSSSHQIKGSWA